MIIVLIRKLSLMKKIIPLIVTVFCLTVSANALTYEEAFETIKAMPHMKGVEGTLVSGDNDFAAIGVTNAQLIVWDGETLYDNETEVYGNELYKMIGSLPVSEMVQGRMSGSSIFAIFAKPVSEYENRIIILSDSGGAGFTGVLIGYINSKNLSALRQAILTPRPEGGTALYLNALNF